MVLLYKGVLGGAPNSGDNQLCVSNHSKHLSETQFLLSTMRPTVLVPQLSGLFLFSSLPLHIVSPGNWQSLTAFTKTDVLAMIFWTGCPSPLQARPPSPTSWGRWKNSQSPSVLKFCISIFLVVITNRKHVFSIKSVCVFLNAINGRNACFSTS